MRENVISRTVQAYSASRSDCPISFLGGLNWRGFTLDCRRAYPRMEGDASVGVPYSFFRNKATVKSWLEDAGLCALATQLAWNRLKTLSSADLSSFGAVELVQAGAVDPIRIFVKGEPHKREKVRTGRFRIIASVSLVDQIVARILFQDQNIQDMLLHSALPSKPGMGLSTDQQLDGFLTHLAGICGDPYTQAKSTDCSGFDFSVPKFLLEDEIEVRNRLTRSASLELVRARRNWCHCLSLSVFALSDGSLYAQTIPGIQKSGSYNTSTSNSRMRYMASLYAGAKWCITMGDDAVEDPSSDESVYASLGLRVEVSSRLEFCSFHFEKGKRGVPLNLGKMLYRLVSYDLRTQIDTFFTAYEAILREWRNLPREDLLELKSSVELLIERFRPECLPQLHEVNKIYY